MLVRSKEINPRNFTDICDQIDIDLGWGIMVVSQSQKNQIRGTTKILIRTKQYPNQATFGQTEYLNLERSRSAR